MNFYTCCGLGGEQIGTVEEYKKYFKSQGYKILSLESKVNDDEHTVVLMLETENDNYFDVELKKIKRIGSDIDSLAVES
jgi:sporulation protein YlmC with PRC-barrel domain